MTPTLPARNKLNTVIVYPILLCVILIALAGCTGSDRGASSMTDEAGRNYNLGADYDTACQMRLAEHYYGKAYEIMKEDPAQDWNLYGSACYRYSCVLVNRGDIERATTVLSEIMERTQGEEEFPESRRAALLTQMAYCQDELKQYDAAKESYAKAYEAYVKSEGGEGKGFFNLMVVGDCGVISFLKMGDYAEAERWLRRSDAELAVYEQNGNPKIVEEYRGLHAIFHARLLHATGHPAQAAAIFDAIPRQRLLTVMGSEYAAQYLMEAGRYDEAAELYAYFDTAFSSFRPTSITFDVINQYLAPRYEALRRAGRNSEALEIADTINVAIDSALQWQKQSDAAELAVIYQTHEKELALEEQKSQTTIFRILAGTALALLLLVGYILWRIHRYNRLLLEKNRHLYKQIKQRELAEEIREKSVESGDNLTQNQQIYNRLCELMQDPEVYTDADANHETLARLVGTNYKYVYDALRECAGLTPADFINRNRIRHAAHLLTTTDEPIGLITEQCGFTNRSTFIRLFREHYSMTPSEYRQAAK